MTASGSPSSPAALTDSFKLAMRSLAGGVTIVAANVGDGAPMGLTATAVTSLSVVPPSLLVCINRGTRLAAILTAGTRFSVTVLAADQLEVAKVFGGQAPTDGADRFSFGRWTISGNAPPRLEGCKAGIDCVVAHVHDWATHHIVIGSVSLIHLDRPKAQALAYVDGAYHAVG